MKPRVPGLIAIIVATLAAIGGYLWWSGVQRRAEVLAASIPTRPSIDGWPGEFRTRLESCERRLADDRDPGRALGEMSRLYHANGFYQEALRCYARLEYLEPKDPVWPHRHATILAVFGDAENALPLWKRVARLAPEFIPARLRQADLLLKQNRFEEAMEAYENVLKRSPENPYAMLGLARCEFEAGRWESARQMLEKVVARTSHRLGYDLLVTVYERLGLESLAGSIRGKQKASGAYRDAFDPWIDVLYDDCYDVYRLSLAAGESMDAGKAAEAIRRLERAIGFAPENASLHFQLATTYLNEGSLTKARDIFERCTTLDPEFADGWANLSSLLTRFGDAKGANRVLAEGLAHCPASPGLHLMNARRLKSAGDNSGAIEEFETSIRLRPNEADAYIELATLFFDSNRVPDGVAQLEKALVAEPDHPTVLSTMAYNAIISGNEPEARKWMERAAGQPRVGSDRLRALRAAYRDRFGRDPGR